jgi:preprotein translocase subunit SecA
MKILDKIFGSAGEKELKNIQIFVDQINELEDKIKALKDEDFPKKTEEFKKKVAEAIKYKEDSERILLTDEEKAVEKKNIEKALEKIMPEALALVREAARRAIGERAYDVQLIGAIALHQGKIAEMKTGEGKTLASVLAAYLNALSGRGVHIVTVNDYLSKRDANWMGSIFYFTGLSVACLNHDISYKYSPIKVDKDEVTVEMENLKAVERREAYECDILYGTNNEFGFDYLRDNMAQRVEQLVQRELNFAIVDEVDSILVDEARTPLIISAQAEESTEKYGRYAKLVQNLKEGSDYTIELRTKTATLTETGIANVEKILEVENIFTEAGFDEVHHLENALKASVIMLADQDYVVRDGQILIVDEFTGRLMPGRRFSDGLHQALEAKENVEIQRESKTLATITFQNYFRLYDKLAGMTGTAETEAEEFAKIYALDTIVIPTNKPMVRQDLPDKIFKNETGKFEALANEVAQLHTVGRPVLIGTINIDKSEALSRLLKSKNIPHEILNAKQHEREAEIVSKAGQKFAVTIATNMAGRGTDIKLGEGVAALGGLAILGTERHESRRIDNQLRGRSGRQGDPGLSQFYVAMSDDLMKRFGGEKMGALMEKLGLPTEEAIENRMISRSVENAQKKIEGFHFDSRKHVVQYDDVMNVHREKIYARRKIHLTSDKSWEDLLEIAENGARQIVESSQLSNSNFDFKAIAEQANSILQTEEVTVRDLQEISNTEQLVEFLRDVFVKNLEKKQKEAGEEAFQNITKQIVLRSIDELWLEHINDMTNLRDRVALAGYAQKDPVLEYRREGFEMFKTLFFRLRVTALANIFRIQFTESLEFKTADYSKAKTNVDEISQTLENTGEFGVGNKNNISKIHASEVPGKSITAEKLGTKFANIGRNDVCPCGSGKKFKKCHGKNL